jgi:hypothetical protein
VSGVVVAVVGLAVGGGAAAGGEDAVPVGDLDAAAVTPSNSSRPSSSTMA